VRELIERIRAICLAFPEVTERPSHGTPTFFVRDKKAFVYAWISGHHDNQFPHLWCAAPDGVQGELIASAPARYFRPPYVGHRGWVGVYVDVAAVDWERVEDLVDAAHLTVAPPRRTRGA
jgi:hypothetical protein